MSYHLYIYPTEVKRFIQAGGDWEDPQTAAFPLPDKFATIIEARLLSYGFSGDGYGEFEKLYGTLPVTVRIYPGSVAFSVPYWADFAAQVFDIRLHAMEMTDVGGVSLYDPQADEWDFGMEDWP